MTTKLLNLGAKLEKCVDLINENLLISNEVITQSANLVISKVHLDLSQTNSLLEKCDDVEEQYKSEKPELRIIHHFACTGGTLVSKLISALPNTFLLSEVHPSTTLHMHEGPPQFRPTDLTSLLRYAGVPCEEQLINKMFGQNIGLINDHLVGIGAKLVLRFHSHSDYCVGPKDDTSLPYIDYLKSKYNIINAVTVRHPLDSFLSLSTNDWVHFTPQTFDEYCTRYLKFVSDFDDEPYFKYEDLLDDTVSVLRQISDKLNLDFSDSFNYTFNLFKVTGDSGRSSDKIEHRERRVVPQSIKNMTTYLDSYKKLCEKLGYQVEI